MKIVYKENALTAEIYHSLRESVGWRNFPQEQAKLAIRNSLYTVVAEYEGRAVGMARLVGDGAINWYVQDVVVHPQHQRRGIGAGMMELLMEHIQNSGFPELRATVGLFAAKGKEDFYKKYGFAAMPDEISGAGMVKRPADEDSPVS